MSEHPFISKSYVECYDMLNDLGREFPKCRWELRVQKKDSDTLRYYVAGCVPKVNADGTFGKRTIPYYTDPETTPGQAIWEAAWVVHNYMQRTAADAARKDHR